MDEAVKHLTGKVNEYCTFYLPGTTIMNQEWKVIDYKDGILTVTAKQQYEAPNGSGNRCSVTYQIPLGKISPQIGGFTRNGTYTVVLATADGSEGIAVTGHMEDHNSQGNHVRDIQGHSVKFAIECHTEQAAEEVRRAFSRLINLSNKKPGEIGGQ